MLGIFVLLCMYDVNALLVEEKKLQSSNAFPNINFLTSSNKLSIIYIYISIYRSKLSKFVFTTAIQLQPKNIKVKEKKSYPHRPTAREGT